MPTPPVIANVFRATFNHFGPQGQTVNILHFKSASGTASQLGADIETASNGNNWCAHLPSTWTTPSVTVLPLDGASAASDFALSHLNGQASGDILPAYAWVISLKTAQRGSRGRGRIYLGPVTEADVLSGGKFLTADATALATTFVAFQAAMLATARAWDLVVASYVHADSHVVTTVRADIPAGIQRRRQDRLAH